jgi:hypothetical protein
LNRARLIVIAASLGLIALTQADPNNPTLHVGGESRGSLFERVFKMFDMVQDIGPWEDQHGDLMIAAENVFELNGWDSESDQFSMRMLREVGEIPPWDPQQRIDHLISMLSDRYTLDSRQEQLIRNTIIKESNKMFFKHAPKAMVYSLEVIQTRAAGEPFTPEQVARWTSMAMPILEDTHNNFQNVAEELMPEFTEAQQALMREDLAANNRRFQTVLQGAERWKRGDWKPEYWGLQDDPIQMAAVWEAEQAAAAEGETPPEDQVSGDDPGSTAEKLPPDDAPPMMQDQPPLRPTQPTRPERTGRGESKPQPRPRSATSEKETDPWKIYVQEFIDKYALTDPQQTAAWRVSRDLIQRRDRVRAQFDQRLAILESRLVDDPKRLKTQQDKLTRDRDQREGVLFEQLKERLDKLPTRAQRSEAEKKAGAPKSSTGKSSKND